ncbi:hypothetical protein GEMRC1_002958 [Eukaryota sp. GEM-RC1]
MNDPNLIDLYSLIYDLSRKQSGAVTHLAQSTDILCPMNLICQQSSDVVCQSTILLIFAVVSELNSSAPALVRSGVLKTIQMFLKKEDNTDILVPCSFLLANISRNISVHDHFTIEFLELFTVKFKNLYFDHQVGICTELIRSLASLSASSFVADFLVESGFILDILKTLKIEMIKEVHDFRFLSFLIWIVANTARDVLKILFLITNGILVQIKDCSVLKDPKVRLQLSRVLDNVTRIDLDQSTERSSELIFEPLATCFLNLCRSPTENVALFSLNAFSNACSLQFFQKLDNLHEFKSMLSFVSLSYSNNQKILEQVKFISEKLHIDLQSDVNAIIPYINQVPRDFDWKSTDTSFFPIWYLIPNDWHSKVQSTPSSISIVLSSAPISHDVSGNDTISVNIFLNTNLFECSASDLGKKFITTAFSDDQSQTVDDVTVDDVEVSFFRSLVSSTLIKEHEDMMLKDSFYADDRQNLLFLFSIRALKTSFSTVNNIEGILIENFVCSSFQ